MSWHCVHASLPACPHAHVFMASTTEEKPRISSALIARNTPTEKKRGESRRHFFARVTHLNLMGKKISGIVRGCCAAEPRMLEWPSRAHCFPCGSMRINSGQPAAMPHASGAVPVRQPDHRAQEPACHADATAHPEQQHHSNGKLEPLEAPYETFLGSERYCKAGGTGELLQNGGAVHSKPAPSSWW